MNRIRLGSYELEDSGGLRLECDIFVPKVSTIPDISVEFKDELIPSTSKLAKDPAIMTGLVHFLKSVGYTGQPPIRISDNDGKSLTAEVNAEFIDFALNLGWIDLTENEEAGAKESLISILDSEDQTPKLISKEAKNIFVTGGHRYLVVGFNDMAEIVTKGILENLERIDSGILAGHSSRKLSESYEERRELITKQKESSTGREDFNEWMKLYLIPDSNFFTFIATSLPKDDVYDIAFGGHFAGKTENHIVFELVS